MATAASDMHRSPAAAGVLFGAVAVVVGFQLPWMIGHETGAWVRERAYSSQETVGSFAMVLSLVPIGFAGFGLLKRESAFIERAKTASFAMLVLCIAAGVWISRRSVEYAQLTKTFDIGFGLYITGAGALLLIICAGGAARLGSKPSSFVQQRREKAVWRTIEIAIVVIFAVALLRGLASGVDIGWCDNFMVPCEP